MKYMLTALVIFLLYSCSEESFINHELKSEKMGDCAKRAEQIKMVSNIAGERYEFEYCLDEMYDAKNYSIIRKGDSLVVTFPKPAGKTALYKLILDVDAKPVYHYITLGDQTIEIAHTDKF